MSNYSISKLKDKFKVSAQTLRNWEKIFELLNIPVPRNSRNHRIYFEEHLRLFEKIKPLAESKNFTMEDIADALRGSIEHQNALSQETQLKPGKSEKQPQTTSNEPQSNFLIEVKKEVKLLLEENNKIIEEKVDNLSEKYARATHQIGMLSAQLEAEQNKNKLLTDSSIEHQNKFNEVQVDLKDTQNKLKRFAEDVIEKNKKIKALENLQDTLNTELQNKDNEKSRLLKEIESLKQELLEKSEPVPEEPQQKVPWYRKIFGS